MTPPRPLILAIDPSSTCTGYALMDAREKVHDAGRLTPDRAKDPANDRIRVMAHEVCRLIGEHAPDYVVIEDTSGKTSKRHKGKGAGLAIYGKAVGWVIAKAEACAGVKVVPVLENTWTAGWSKDARQYVAQTICPTYKPESDPGKDVADAIALALWFTRMEQAADERRRN